MLDETLVALAAAGGAAVAEGAGTDAWHSLRGAVARWIGRGDAERERTELERLDQTASEVQSTEAAEAERARIRQQGMWQMRIEMALEDLDASERARATEELSALLVQHRARRAESAGPHAGDVTINANAGGIAASVMNGDLHIGGHAVRHTSPGPENEPDDDWPQES